METVEDRVKQVTARLLKLKSADIKAQDSFAVDLGAESIQSVELVAMFEEEFGIEMDEEQALSVETVGAAVEYITKACEDQGIES